MFFLSDLGNWSVKKMKAVNVKKTLLFECGTNVDNKNRWLPHEFRVFREQSSFLAKVSKS